MTDTNLETHVKAFAQGDERAFDLLFLKYQPKLVAFIESFVKNHETARDISQDVFLKLWRERERCHQVKSFKSYLFHTAKFAIYDYLDHSLVEDKYLLHALRKPTLTDNVEEQIFANQLQELIDATLLQMTPQRRKIFIMSRKKNLSNSDIAEQLGINKRTVENHLSAALSEIRKVIKLMILLWM
uniref:RNA polymerase sigma-70 factor n=1 Tax=Prevotella sp. GTC17254 TaxID=3236794 RepID=A0AB33IXJ2_9BACT